MTGPTDDGRRVDRPNSHSARDRRPSPDDLHDVLRSIVGDDHVLVDPDLRSAYERDWTGRYGGGCDAVVRPGTTAEVAAVVRACAERRIDVVPQAGNTGLVGAGVPRADAPSGGPAVVLSVRRLDRIESVDTAAMQVTLGAGVTLATWRDHARAAGVDAPVDFAARDSATIGGAIATNAGGSRVLRFGTMRSQVMGIEAVLANGEIVGSLAGLPKETVGIHWPSLLSGSEGTLGVVTAARLRVVPHFASTVTALIALRSIDDGVDLVGMLRRRAPSLDAVELIQPAAMGLVSAHLGSRPPVAAPSDGSYLVVECADHDDPTDELTAVLGDAPGIIDTAVTTGGPRRDSIVAFRDRITEAIAAESTRIGIPTFKLDVAVPIRSLHQVLDIAHRVADEDGSLLIPFGHLAEGNLHLNHLGATDTERIADTVLRAVADLGGTISAEHGVGIAKSRWLPLIRSDGDLAARAAIKSALDPLGILNPGVLDPGFDPSQVP